MNKKEAVEWAVYCLKAEINQTILRGPDEAMRNRRYSASNPSITLRFIEATLLNPK